MNNDWGKKDGWIQRRGKKEMRRKKCCSNVEKPFVSTCSVTRQRVQQYLFAAHRGGSQINQNKTTKQQNTCRLQTFAKAAEPITTTLYENLFRRSCGAFPPDKYANTITLAGSINSWQTQTKTSRTHRGIHNRWILWVFFFFFLSYCCWRKNLNDFPGHCTLYCHNAAAVFKVSPLHRHPGRL